jgi:hypothetical protein
MIDRLQRVHLGRFLAGISALTVFFPKASVAATSSLATVPGGISRMSNFEEEGRPGIGHYYIWRNNGIVASLGLGGSVTIRIPARPEILISFLGANRGVQPQGETASGYLTYYYLGSPSRWFSTLRYERIRYRDIYPGIDLIFVPKNDQLEYNFELNAGADPRRIRIRYRGGKARLDRYGNIQIGEWGQGIKQGRPSVFQDMGTEAHRVACDYVLTGDEVTMRLGPHDRERPLMIDPVLQFSTYLGGASFDAAYAVTTDAAGNFYVTGETGSRTLPGGSAPNRASRDVWVAKLNSTGSKLLYVTYLGGGGNDAGKGIAVDSSGNAYITGDTSSTDFPTTNGAFARNSSGAPDAFVVKLSSS